MTTWDPTDPTPEQQAAIDAVGTAIAYACHTRGWLEDDELVTEWVACVYTQRASDRPGRGSHCLIGPLTQPAHHEIGLLRLTLQAIERSDDD